jgi:hypothetical protein
MFREAMVQVDCTKVFPMKLVQSSVIIQFKLGFQPEIFTVLPDITTLISQELYGFDCRKVM